MRAKWISKETWQLADHRAALHWAGIISTREVCKARPNFQCALQADRPRRVKAMGASIEGLLEAVRLKEAWGHLVRWYLKKIAIVNGKSYVVSLWLMMFGPQYR